MRMLFLLLFLLPMQALAGGDAEAIAALLGATFDTAGAKVITRPVAVVDGYAIADWLQGEHGGRALLAKRQGGWKIISCGGRALLNKQHLISAGLDPRQASGLVEQLTAAEDGLDRNNVLLFDAFQGERAH